MTPADFRAWRKRLGLSQSGAAEALGISPRMVWSYENGEHPLPKTVALACEAVEAREAP